MAKKKSVSLSAAPIIVSEYYNPAVPKGFRQLLQMLDEAMRRVPERKTEPLPSYLFCAHCGQMWHTGFGDPAEKCDFCGVPTNWLAEPPLPGTLNSGQIPLFSFEEAAPIQASLF